MERGFLGDALDSWKGSLLRRLTEAAVLHELRIEPLISDPQWSPDDYGLYCDLLDVPQGAIVQHKHEFGVDRANYVSEIPVSGDLFLDPDTGVATHKVKRAARVRYIAPGEVADLAAADPERVLAIYQHVSRVAVHARALRVAQVLRAAAPALSICSAESATVAMLFVSHSDPRIRAILTSLQAFFRSKAPDRTAFLGAA